MKTLPKGFKDSDIGPIPQDWEVRALGHVCSMHSGQTITAKNIDHTGSYPCYGGNGVRGYTQTYTHDGVFPIIGRQGALCGNTKLASGKFYASEHAVVVTCNQKTGPIWLYYMLESMDLNQYAEATAQPGLAVSKILRQYIPHPTLQEQQAIARALSDMDDLISAQEELLAKKRAIKQGAMQELLTGRRRLPGFSSRPMKQTDIGPIPEDWVVKELGETLTICHGKSQHEVEAPYAPFPIMATGGQIGWATECLYDKPSVLIGRKGTIDKPQYIEKPFWTVDTLFYSKVYQGYIPKFLYYKCLTIDWCSHNEGTGLPSLNATRIQQIPIGIPSSISEQAAIAAVLSDMDAEITAVEEELAKHRALKRGMMQELLSGRIRLPYNKPTHRKQHA